MPTLACSLDPAQVSDIRCLQCCRNLCSPSGTRSAKSGPAHLHSDLISAHLGPLSPPFQCPQCLLYPQDWTAGIVSHIQSPTSWLQIFVSSVHHVIQVAHIRVQSLSRPCGDWYSCSIHRWQIFVSNIQQVTGLVLFISQCLIYASPVIAFNYSRQLPVFKFICFVQQFFRYLTLHSKTASIKAVTNYADPQQNPIKRTFTRFQ